MFSGLPAPGRFSNTPRFSASAICWSIHEVKLCCRGLRSVISIHFTEPTEARSGHLLATLVVISGATVLAPRATGQLGLPRRVRGPVRGDKASHQGGEEHLACQRLQDRDGTAAAL